MPKVSIIIPNYNHAKFLKQRLDSVFNQTFQDFEVILLDDASTDGSQDLLKAYKSHPKVSHVIFNVVNSGSPFKQWQKGIELANGDYIWIAESDDYCEFNFLETMLQLMKTDSNVALAYSQSYRVDDKSKITGNWLSHTAIYKPNIFTKSFVMEGKQFLARYLIQDNVIPNVSAVLIRKVNLEKISPLIFKPFLKYNADWLYYTQLLCDAKVAFEATSLNYFREHQSSVIARANIESGKLKIYDMELKMRDMMYRYFKSKQLNEEAEIRFRWKQKYARICILKAEIYTSNKQYYKALTSVVSNVLIFKQVCHYVFERIKIKLLRTI